MSSAFLPLRNVVSNQSVINTAALNLTSTAVALGLNATSSVAPNLSNGTWSTWSTAKSGMTHVKKVAMSSTGQYQLIVVSAIGASTLWLSSDSGATWSQCPAYGLPPGTSYTYSAGSISADGQRITIGVQGDLLYVSSDAGATFNNPQPGVTPYAWLRCENNTTDTMGNDVTVSPSAPTFFTVTPSSGSSYSMGLSNTVGSSASRYVNFNWTGATNFTISGWFNPQTLPSAYQIICSAYTSYVAVGIDPTNKFFAIMPSGGGTNYVNLGVSATALTLYTWYYFTYIFQANGLCSIYLNNTLLGTLVNTQGTGSITPTKFSVGCYDISLNTPFNGLVDDIRVTNSAITYQSVILPPRTWLKFENNTTDSMGIITPTIAGTISYVPGRVGSSAVVITNTAGGTPTNYIRGTLSSTATGPLTMTCWFNMASYPGNGQIATVMSIGGNPAGCLHLYYLNNVGGNTGLYAEFFNNSYTVVRIGSVSAISLNTWYHCTVIYQSSGTCYFYVNSQLVGSVAGTPFLNAPNGFGIGTYSVNVSTTDGFNGYIDNVKIYTSAVFPPSSSAAAMSLSANWSQLAMSGTGQYQLAGTEYGRVFQSADYGRTWSYSTTASSTGLVKSLSLSHTGQYQMVNAQKWVSPNSTAASAATWFNNGVTWTATASSTYSAEYQPYYAFNNTPSGTSWSGVGSAYTSGAYTANTYSTTAIGITGAITGDWIQLASSVPLVMTSYLMGSGNGASQLPKTYTIVGSNDGTTWYAIHSASIVSNPVSSALTMWSTAVTVNTTGSQTVQSNSSSTVTTTAYSYATMPFTYFRIIVTSIWITGNAELGEFTPNFLAANTYTPQQPGLSVFTWDQNGITYTASSSTNFAGSNFAYSAFNNLSTGSTWGSAQVYDTTTGAYPVGGATSTTIQGGIGAIKGEWLQLQTSIPMILQSYAVGNWGVATLPKTYYIVGSTDGSTWYPIQYMSFTTNPFTNTFRSSTRILTNYTGTQYVFGDQQGVGTTTSYTTSATPYTYFRIVVTSLFASSTGVAEFSEFAPVFLAGQHYSTNYGSSWSPVPSTYLTTQSAISPSGQYQMSLNNNPVTARLTMDGTFADSMGSLTGPTVTGAPTASTSIYRVGTASAYFANTAGGAPSNYLLYTLPAAWTQPSTFTLSCWAYPTTFTGNSGMVGLTGSSGGTFGPELYFDPSGYAKFWFPTTTVTGGTSIASPITYSLNNWYHFVATCGGGVIVLYINGMVVSSTTYTGSFCGQGGVNLTGLMVGSGISGNEAFRGYVDDVRLYPYALGAEQVYDLYRTPTSQGIAITSNYMTDLATVPSYSSLLVGNSAPLVDAATSYNGQYMIIVSSATTGNNVWYSTNYGVSWTAVAVTVTAPLVSCTMSHDGSYATTATLTTVYTLNNNGTGFTLAVGAQAGQVSQGQNAIAIGNKAGQVNQTANSIVLNATGSAVTAAQSGFYVAPIATSTSTATSGITLLGYGDDKQIVQTNTITGDVTVSEGVLRVNKTSPSIGSYLLSYSNGFNAYVSMRTNSNINGHGFELASEVATNAGHIINRENAPIYLRVNNTTFAMTIMNNGNVGIGTGSTSNRLAVYKTLGTSDYTYVAQHQGQFAIFSGTGTTGQRSMEMAVLDDGIGVIQVKESGIGYNTLLLNPVSGNVGIGTTVASYKLHVIGEIYASGDISAFSDQRYKTNVQPLESPLETVSKLKGVSYHRIDDEPEKKRLGFLAQEVAEVYPEAVSYDAKNDKYSVSYLSLVAPLVEAIKELKKELAATNQKYEAIAKWATAQGYTEAPL